MVYLIVQIDNDQPATIPFENKECMDHFIKEKFGNKTCVGITENVYLIHEHFREQKSDI